jgi:hypothetical protein
MLQKDYLLRLIQIMMKGLMRVSALVEEKKYNDALEVINETGKMITGLDFKMLSYLSYNELSNLIKSNDGLYKGKFLILGQLLSKEGDLFFQINEDEKGLNSVTKALCLMVDGVEENNSIDFKDYEDKIEHVIEILSRYSLETDVYLKLIKYFELTGSYSRADDIIYEIAERREMKIYITSVIFYEKLLEIDEEKLQQGNFSVEEAKESLQYIKQFSP